MPTPNGLLDAGGSSTMPSTAVPAASQSPHAKIGATTRASPSNSHGPGNPREGVAKPARLAAPGGMSLPPEAFTPSGGPNPWAALAPPTAGAGSSAVPDYFSSVHIPDAGGSSGSGGMRIASPFALPSSGAKTPFEPAGSEPHPWAGLFGDSGMKTALPDHGLNRTSSTSAFAIPPTPAANADSVPQRQTPGTGLRLPSSTLPAVNSLKLPGPFQSGGASATSSAASGTSRAASSRTGSGGGEDFSRFKALDVEGLAKALSPPSWATETKGGTIADDVLVLDIRPSTSFQTARIHASINICAPSTLLKRPGITVERIEQDMLAGARERRRFMRWRKGPLRSEKGGAQDAPKKAATIHTTDESGINKIIVLDTDTANVGDAGNATAGGGGPCLIGMLKKFEIAGFAGELCWLRGGFNRLVSTALGKSLIESGPAAHGNAHDIGEDSEDAPTSVFQDRSAISSPMQLQPPSSQPSRPSSMDSARKGSLVRPRGLPMEAFQAQSTVAGWPGMSQSERPGRSGNPIEAVGPQAGERAPGEAQRNACANPFFDNIRQNRELAHGITEKIPMDLPKLSPSQVEALPRFLRELVQRPSEERATTLAQGFFEVEKAEQQRLMATMQQHAAESGQDPRALREKTLTAAAGGSDDGTSQIRPLSPSSAVDELAQSSQQHHRFPFSISAALERGADNRYNNIWTYEHSRVRLSKPQVRDDPGSDYLNASFVAPAKRFGSRRKYIATQAPLPSTFEAFWTTIWEQNSRVIVMLTREHESGRLQSHPYWNDSGYGESIRIDKIEEVVLDEHGKAMGKDESRGVLQPASSGGGLFSNMAMSSSSEPKPSTSPSAGTPTTIRRTFRLRNLAEPSAPPRRITQLQYIAWPDYHIPDSPDSMLDLMDAADALQDEADREMRQTAISSGQSASLEQAHAGPMVVHCSAGVGRTGAFIVIDSALDVLRRHRRRQGASLSDAESERTWQNLTAAEDVGKQGEEGARMPDIDMPLATPSRRRSPRRSLKRELSPTGMDLDGNLDEYHRDVSSPPPTLRTRSSDGGSATHEGGLDVGSWSSSSSSAAGTPSRAFGSLQIASAASPGVVNPFAAKFAASPFNLDGANSSAADVSTSSVDTVGRDRGPSRFLFGASSSSVNSASSSSGVAGQPPQPQPQPQQQATTSSANDYRGATGSSPFSEASAPVFPTGLSSARSSFSSTSANDKPRIELERSASSFSQASTCESSVAESQAGEAMNPFEKAMAPSVTSTAIPGHELASASAEARAKDRSGSGSNEPTPFPTYLPNGAAPVSADDETARRTAEALEGGEDVIRKTVDTAREQRMSLIQTGRQYVFVYSAVLAALLRDIEREKSRRAQRG
ncbi:related to Protein-tyrosine phosphatase, receptor type 1 [Pseudozyma flocculosa]|nr:related to Protein-tyrosine phosphatase, receptor type 1 [Pseudozyma flocculosa]